MVLHGDSHQSHLARGLHLAHRLLPLGIERPIVVPGVELVDVDAFTAEVLQSQVQAREHILLGEGLLERISGFDVPHEVFGRHLAGDNHLRGFSEGAGDELLAVAVAISQRGVEEVDTRITRSGKRAQGFFVVGANPHGFANAPGAVADVADLDSRLTEAAVLHGFYDSTAGRDWRWRLKCSLERPATELPLGSKTANEYGIRPPLASKM